jgi:hypothetical protein
MKKILGAETAANEAWAALKVARVKKLNKQKAT